MEQLAVYVTPKAQRNEVVGLVVDATGLQEVSVRVTSAPEGGKATKAVCETVAKALGIAKGRVKVVRGGVSRHKMLAIDIDKRTLDVWLANL